MSKSSFLPLIDEKQKYFLMRKQILGQPTPRQSQVAMSAALADIDNDPPDDDERQQPNPHPEKSEEKIPNYNEKFFTHFTYEKRFETCKRDMHQVYHHAFKDTPAMYRKQIVGNRNRRQAQNELIRRRPNKTLLQNTTITKLPGLSLSFHHVRPRLYKISYHGQCSVDSGTRNWVRMMVDGRILISNRLYPNTEQRLDYDPSVSTDMSTFLDSRGGALYYSTGVTDFPSSKVETVYLSAGIHTIEVVARTDRGFRIHNGELHVELIEFEPSEMDAPVPLCDALIRVREIITINKHAETVLTRNGTT
ncbi:unnamed protein product [Rotaria magnacalcarata]